MKDREYSIIYDNVHKSISIPPKILDVIRTKAFQRLTGVKQLGLTYLVFPGAVHTRFEHSLGTFYVSSRVSQFLKLDEYDALSLQYAALLHDIGHGPLSHTLDTIFRRFYNVDHVDTGISLIKGALNVADENGAIPDSIEKNGVKIDDVVKIISGVSIDERKHYLHELLDGEADIDQIDYLMRDGYHTGIAYGSIDYERLIRSYQNFSGHLVISRKGINAAEGLLVARILMYSSVYYHKTVRIAEVMICRAAEHALKNQSENIALFDDAELYQYLLKSNEISADLTKKVRYRDLYKKAYIAERNELNENQLAVLNEFIEQPDKRSEYEDKISVKITGKPFRVFIDLPGIELKKTKRYRNSTKIKIMKNDHIIPLNELSPIAGFINGKDLVPYSLLAIAPKQYVDDVNKEIKKLLG